MSLDIGGEVFLAGILIIYTITVIKSKLKATIIFAFAVLLAFLLHIPRHVLLDIRFFEILTILFSLMILAGVLKRGVFYGFILRFFNKKQLDSKKILMMIAVVSAILSAFIDNVLVVYYFVGLLFIYAKEVNIDPKPFVYTTIIVSNLAALGTLTGDISNIVLGVWRGYSFLTFLQKAGMIALISTVVAIIYMYHVCKLESTNIDVVEKDLVSKVVESETTHEETKVFLYYGIIVLIITIFGMPLSEILGLSLSSFLGLIAVAILFLGGEHMKEIFEDIRWEYFLYLIGLLTIMKGIVYSTSIDMLTEITKPLLSSPYSVFFTSLIVSSIIDDVELSVIAIPVLTQLQAGDAAWWALILGSSFGSALSPLGAYSNILALSQFSGYKLKDALKDFFKLSIPPVAVGIVISLILLNIGFFGDI